jgi:hypothetical protein
VSYTPLHFHTIQQLKWVSGGGINSPRHPKSRWLTATEKVALDEPMLCFSRASVHLVPSTSLSHCRSADTTALMLYTDGTSDHPMLKDSLPKPYCPHLRDRRMNRCSTVGSSVAEALVLACLCLDSNWVSDRPTVSQLRPSIHLVLLTLLLLLCNSSGASRNWTVGSSNGALAFTQCTYSSDHCTDACYLGTVGSSDSVLSFLFLLILACGILHPWDLEMSTRTCLTYG